MQNKPNNEVKKTPKRVLVCEFITGGGLCAAPLPPSLAKEGEMMRDALLCDLKDCVSPEGEHYHIVTMHDVRLSPAINVDESHPIEGDFDAFESQFKQLIMQVDYVWLIAPETDGMLLRLSEHCYALEEAQNTTCLIGCGYDAVLTGTSKSLAFEALQEEHIHTLPVYAGDALLEPAYFNAVCQDNQAIKQWVAKVEDGAGCEGMRMFDDLTALRDWLVAENLAMTYFAQPFQAGVPASFCMLCAGGKAWLLSANLQHVVLSDNRFKLTGITLNGATAHWQQFETLARKLAKSMPDALGYMGVDVIIDKVQNKIFVIDINPRLSTSYVGLREAISANPAQLILDCVLRDNFKMPTLSKNKVDVSICVK